MKGSSFPNQYARVSEIAKPLEALYADLDGFTCEIAPDEDYYFYNIDFSVLVPPLAHEGVFLKGLFYSQGIDVLLERFPRLNELFFSIANSMTFSLAWTTRADTTKSVFRSTTFSAL